MDLRWTLACWFLVALACSTNTWAEEPPGKSLSGTVVDEAGQPVANALVRSIESRAYLRDHRPAPKMKTDAQGKFAYPLREQAQFASLWFETPDGRIAQALVFELDKPLQVTVKPAHEIAVLVQDDQGQPLTSARVLFLANSQVLQSGETDAAGKFVCRVPAELPNWHVCAWKSQAGIDFVSSAREEDESDKPPAAKLPDNVTLKLAGATPIHVKAVDHRGKPVAGVRVGPWTYRKSEDETSEINLSGTADFWPQTDKDGLVTVDWLPLNSQAKRRWSFISTTPEYYAPQHQLTVPAELPAEPLTLNLLPYTELTGRVLHADGKPAANMNVEVQGQGTNHSSFRGATRTDNDGRYKIKAYPEQAYIVTAGDEQWQAANMGAVIRVDQPVKPIDITLQRAVTLSGHVTVGPNKLPVDKVQIIAVLDGGELTKELPRDKDDRVYYSLRRYSFTNTDAEGKYQFVLPPGKYQLQGPPHTQPLNVTLPDNGPTQIVRDFHMPRAEKGPLQVTVVDEQDKPVANATVDGRYASSSARGWFKPAKTNEQGQLKVERSLDPLVLYARSADGKFAGVARTAAEETVAEVKLLPVAGASGTLLDKAGQPVADRDMTYGIRIYMGEDTSSPFSDSFGGSTKTNAQGEFRIEGLIPWQKYEVSIQLDKHSSRTVKTLKPTDSQPIAIGELRVDPDPIKPYVPPTPAERAAKAFATKTDIAPDERVKTLLAEGKREYTRPLLLIGPPTDPASVELFRLFEQNDVEKDAADKLLAGPTPQQLRWEFELAALGSDREAVQAFAKQRKLDLAAGPVLAVLNGAGDVEDILQLKLKDQKLSGAEVGAWLAKYKFAQRDAQATLDKALAQATAEDKRVFFVLSASWCGPCRMLSRFLAPFKPELEEHFIFVKIDISRDKNAQELQKRFKESAQGGVPWFCIVDPQGKVLTTSNRPTAPDERVLNSNIGFPSEPESIQHFLNMLSISRPSLSKALLDEMEKELKKQP